MKAKPGNAVPRLLMLTAFRPNPVSGGALLRQLLRGFPRGQLHWWTSDADCGKDPDHETDQVIYYPIPARLVPHERLTTLKSWIVEKFWVPRAAAHLQKVVATVQPDQIWAQLTGWLIPVLARTRLVGTQRCHVSLWDYHNTRMHCQRVGIRRAHHWAHLTEELFRQATTADAISQPMWEDLAGRTGRTDAMVVHSGFEPEQLEWLRQNEPAATPEIQIAYAGTIIVPRVFELFVRALEIIRASFPRPLRLNFFGRSYGHEPWFDPTWMQNHGLLEECHFQESLRRCTWGFSPMDLTDDDPNYNRYSFPNKFGSYIAAGLPVIVLAHPESSAAKMMRDYALGVYSDTPDLDKLVPVLRAALAEPHPKQRYRLEMLRCAQTEFDAARMRRQLWDLLRIP